MTATTKVVPTIKPASRCDRHARSAGCLWGPVGNTPIPHLRLRSADGRPPAAGTVRRPHEIAFALSFCKVAGATARAAIARAAIAPRLAAPQPYHIDATSTLWAGVRPNQATMEHAATHARDARSQPPTPDVRVQEKLSLVTTAYRATGLVSRGHAGCRALPVANGVTVRLNGRHRC
jgi:hypothetical protein